MRWAEREGIRVQPQAWQYARACYARTSGIYKSHQFLVLVVIGRFNDVIQTILKISIKQTHKEVAIWCIINHLLLCSPPCCGEVEMFLLQMGLQHLEGLLQEGANSVPSLGIRLRARGKDTFTRDRRCLDWQIVHCHREKSGKSCFVNLRCPISNIEIPFTKSLASQNFRMWTVFSESGAVMYSG